MGLGRTLVTGGSGFIGTNLIEALLERGTDFINIDKARPNISQHDKFWRPLDIMDVEGLRRIFAEFRPETVIHLAALVDDRGTTLEDYAENTVGTMNVVRAGDAVGTVTRLIVTSTQFVVKAGYVAKDDEDLAPHTLYGESKAEMERMVRAAPPRRTAWTIVRPTLVWGPWHPRYPEHAWRYLARRWYFHPVTARPVVRSYAYVGNVVSQMIAALERPAELVHGRAFYVGDEPMPSEMWVDAFSIAFTGKPSRRLPFALLRLMGLGGDVLRLLRLPAPIWSGRLFVMSSDYVVPMKPTFDVFGPAPFTLEQGVAKSVAWLRASGRSGF
jgi:nucleoside-diphosphate-sugar epimerase